MTALLKQVEHHLKPLKAIHSKIVLALSGGVDSRVLLELLRLLKQNDDHWHICAVHVHHGLSENADKWQRKCKTWCLSSDIEYFCEKVQLSPQPRQSLEQLARDARYQALAKYVDQQTILVTGHHADDQLETLMLALKRGSGPKGLSAMGTVSEFALGKLLRPLLNVERDAIEAYAIAAKLEWVDDESNQDTSFDRNFLRHQVSPVLKARWPSIAVAASRSAMLCADQESLLSELLEPDYQRCFASDTAYLAQLATCSELKQKQLLRMWIERQGGLMPSASQLEQLLEQVHGAATDKLPVIQLGDYQIRRYRQQLYWLKEVANIPDFQAPLRLNQWLELPNGQGQLGLFDAQIDLELVEEVWQIGITSVDLESLTVSYSSTGLSAKPVGRSGTRPLKKLWHEFQIPPWRRQQNPIVLSGDNVVCVAGLFVDQQFCGDDYKVIWKSACKSWHTV